MIPTFASRRKAWSNPPIDDIGYLPSRELLTWDTADLIDIIGRMAESRYSGWRNWEMRWRTTLKLDHTEGKRVLDYGCGVGLEALQYAKRGNRVWLADISQDNLNLAQRILSIEGQKEEGTFLVKEKAPLITPAEPFDVIHCVGVLHHIPDAESVVEAMHGWLADNGELRLMVYSDEAWRIATGTEPPAWNVESDPSFDLFWQHWDPIGGYADWYDCKRLNTRFGKWFTVDICQPLTQYGEYLGAVLVKR